MEKTVTIKLVKSPITHPKNQRENFKSSRFIKNWSNSYKS